MGEPAAEAATSERDVLLATKLNVPGLRPDLVPRSRLAERLDDGLARGLVLVCASAGYGKTTLLAGVLTLARPQGYVRVFADEGPPMAALLGRLIAAQRSGGTAAQVPLGYLARLQRALGAQDVVPDAGRGPGPARPPRRRRA